MPDWSGLDPWSRGRGAWWSAPPGGSDALSCRSCGEQRSTLPALLAHERLCAMRTSRRPVDHAGVARPGALRSLGGLLGQGLSGPDKPPGGWSVEAVMVGLGVLVLLAIALGQGGLV